MKKIVAFAAALVAGCSAFAIDAVTVMTQAHDVEKPAFTMSKVKMDLIEKSSLCFLTALLSAVHAWQLLFLHLV